MKGFILLTTILFSHSVFAEWTIDLSRRQKDLERLERDSLLANEKKQNPIEQIFEKPHTVTKKFRPSRL